MRGKSFAQDWEEKGVGFSRIGNELEFFLIGGRGFRFNWKRIVSWNWEGEG